MGGTPSVVLRCREKLVHPESRSVFSSAHKPAEKRCCSDYPISGFAAKALVVVSAQTGSPKWKSCVVACTPDSYIAIIDLKTLEVTGHFDEGSRLGGKTLDLLDGHVEV
jgi:hypothetical protein